MPIEELKPLGARSLLTRKQQVEIEKAVVELLEDYGFISYPLSVGDVASALKIELIPYSTLPPSGHLLACLTSDDAFSLSTSDYMVAEMAVNDAEGMNIYRSRFSGAHEIGHTWLEHSEETPFNEASADYFAGYALAPHPLVLQCRNVLEVSERFGISMQSANYAWDQAHDRMSEGTNLRPHERWLLNNITWKGGGFLGRP